jgi:hypothetical protein
VTVTAPSGGYGVPSSASLEWSGVTATAPSGATLNYAVGGGTISLPGPWYVVMQDPSNTGGNKVMLYTNISSLPYWAKVVLTVNSLPAYGTVATYTL